MKWYDEDRGSLLFEPVKLRMTPDGRGVSNGSFQARSAWPAQARRIADELANNPLPLSREVLRKRLLDDRGWIFADYILSRRGQ